MSICTKYTLLRFGEDYNCLLVFWHCWNELKSAQTILASVLTLLKQDKTIAHLDVEKGAPNHSGKRLHVYKMGFPYCLWFFTWNSIWIFQLVSSQCRQRSLFHGWENAESWSLLDISEFGPTQLPARCVDKHVYFKIGTNTFKVLE